MASRYGESRLGRRLFGDDIVAGHQSLDFKRVAGVQMVGLADLLRDSDFAVGTQYRFQAETMPQALNSANGKGERFPVRLPCFEI